MDGQVTEIVEGDVPSDALPVQQQEPVDYQHIADIVSAEVDAALGEVGIDALSSKVDELAADTAGVASDVVALRTAVESEGSASTVVLVDATQWEEMRESWEWLKQGFSVALFLVLVVTLLVAALFGNRLWQAMATGWRTKAA